MDARMVAAGMLCATLVCTAGCEIFAPRRAPTPDVSPTTDQSAADAAPAQSSDNPEPVDPQAERISRWAEQFQRQPLASDARMAASTDIEPLTYEPIDDYGYVPIDEPGITDSPGESAAEPQDQPEPVATPQSQPAASAPAVPVLRGLTVSAALPGMVLSAADPGDSAAANTPQRAAVPPSIEEMLQRWLASSPGGTFRDQLDSRIVAVLAGRYDAARQPLESVSQQQQQMASQLVETLIAIREAHGADPGREVGNVLAEVARLEAALRPLSDLTIPRLVLARSVEGFGRYQAFEPAEFAAGVPNELVVYCELANFVSRAQDDGQFVSRFGMRVEVLNRVGDVVYQMSDDEIVDRCRSRRRDCFISALIRLPATLSPGRYVVKVAIIDKIGQKVAEKRTTLKIVARS